MSPGNMPRKGRGRRPYQLDFNGRKELIKPHPIYMNTLSPVVAGIMGLGIPELTVIVLLLMVLAAPVVLIVWLIVGRTGKTASGPASAATNKKCPDCAEFVLCEARVCKHCGYRFDGVAAGKA